MLYTLSSVLSIVKCRNNKSNNIIENDYPHLGDSLSYIRCTNKGLLETAVMTSLSNTLSPKYRLLNLVAELVEILLKKFLLYAMVHISEQTHGICNGGMSPPIRLSFRLLGLSLPSS